MYLQPKRMGLTVVGLVSFLWLSGVGLPRLVLAQMSTPSGRVGELQPRGKQVIPPVDSDDNPQTSPGGEQCDIEQANW